MPRSALIIATLSLLLAIGVSPALAAGNPQAAAPWQNKVDPWVLETGADGPTEFLVFLADQADVSGAAALGTKTERGDFVYRALSRHAERTQGPLRQRLAELDVEYRPYWVANMIWVRAGLDVVQTLAERPEVARINANPSVKLDLPEAAEADAAAEASAPEAVEWNITRTKAPDVWAAGFKGAGAVIAGQDTGYRWTHTALKGKYRGWDGASASHDYNWHDAIHTTGSTCGANSPMPCDDNGHGTHTMGTMAGDDGGANQVGMAPAAKWIGCRNMNAGVGTPATYSECYQWFIAPTKIDGTGADPSKAPDVINNSWGCPPSEGCTDPNVLRTVVQNVTAAGIVTVHSAGNDGSACSTVADPAAIYAESFSVGATTNTDAIASFSSRGPVTIDGSNRMKPNISAPGVGIRSSTSTNDSTYAAFQGTSMAGPHVAGLVALLISANPNLRGNVDAIRHIIEQSAAHLTTSQLCGADTTASVPNNVFGWGRIDAFAAYQQATGACAPPAAISNLSIVKLNASQIQLAWTGPTGTTAYDVWWSGAPYFLSGATCSGNYCATVAATSHTQAALGNTAFNHTWLVRPQPACGGIPMTPSNRVGEFEYGLVKGMP